MGCNEDDPGGDPIIMRCNEDDPGGNPIIMRWIQGETLYLVW